MWISKRSDLVISFISIDRMLKYADTITLNAGVRKVTWLDAYAQWNRQLNA